jgi:hypothetical protein
MQIQRDREPLFAGHLAVTFDLFVQGCRSLHQAPISESPLRDNRTLPAAVAALESVDSVPHFYREDSGQARTT